MLNKQEGVKELLGQTPTWVEKPVPLNDVVLEPCLAIPDDSEVIALKFLKQLGSLF